MKTRPANKGKPIRNSAKAVVVARGRLLLVRIKSPTDEWCALPGGGQDKGETLGKALVREVREETGYKVKPGPLVIVSEYIGKNHEFAAAEWDAHQVDHVFLCRLVGGRRRPPSRPDTGQVAVEWVPLAGLGRVRLYPKYLRKMIPAFLRDGRMRGYLGDIN